MRRMVTRNLEPIFNFRLTCYFLYQRTGRKRYTYSIQYIRKREQSASSYVLEPYGHR